MYLPRRVAPHAGHVGARVVLPPSQSTLGAAHLAPLLDGLLDLPLGHPELLAVIVLRILDEQTEPELVLARLSEHERELLVANTAIAAVAVGAPPERRVVGDYLEEPAARALNELLSFFESDPGRVRAVSLLLLGRQLPLECFGGVLRPARKALGGVAGVEVAHNTVGEDAGALIALKGRGNEADDRV